MKATTICSMKETQKASGEHPAELWTGPTGRPAAGLLLEHFSWTAEINFSQIKASRWRGHHDTCTYTPHTSTPNYINLQTRSSNIKWFPHSDFTLLLCPTYTGSYLFYYTPTQIGVYVHIKISGLGWNELGYILTGVPSCWGSFKNLTMSLWNVKLNLWTRRSFPQLLSLSLFACSDKCTKVTFSLLKTRSS